jgi:DNA-binding NarL/FixJ family response regulator
MTSQGITQGRSPHAPADADIRERSAVHTRELYVHAALGYALLALSEARNGRHGEAMEALEAADGLLVEFSPADAQVALRVQLAIARTAMIVGDAAMARRALGRTQQLRALTVSDRAPEDVDAPARQGDLQSSPCGMRAGLLTPTELRLLILLSHDSSFEEIAATLHVSPSTLDMKVSSVYRKLGVRSRSEAVRASEELGFFDS